MINKAAAQARLSVFVRLYFSILDIKARRVPRDPCKLRQDEDVLWTDWRSSAKLWTK